MVDAVLEAFQGAWQITIHPAGTVVEIAMIWRRAPRYEDTMKEQREDFMRRIAGLPFRVILAGRSVNAVCGSSAQPYEQKSQGRLHNIGSVLK